MHRSLWAFPANKRLGWKCLPLKNQGTLTEGGRLSTIDLIRVVCLVKKKIMFKISKAADLNKLVQEGQLYRAFPFSKDWLL